MLMRSRIFAAGFGAHHWQGTRQGAPLAFITLDSDVNIARSELEGAYASAYELAAAGLTFVVASVPSVSGEFTVPIPDGVLSLTPWTEGVTPTSAAAADPTHLEETIRALNELHYSSVKPPSLPPWRPRFERDSTVYLSELLATPWSEGPLGEIAREMLQSSLQYVQTTTNRFHELSDIALHHADGWVPTHGEPHYANQMIVGDRLVFVDWETLRLAPKERDIAGIPRMGWQYFSPNPEMMELYKLEWTLCEIDEYSAWFSRPHTGNQDDQDALAKLRKELEPSHS